MGQWEKNCWVETEERAKEYQKQMWENGVEAKYYENLKEGYDIYVWIET